MPTIGDKIRELHKVSIKSKVMFSGEYLQELENIMNEIDEKVEKEIVPSYNIDSISYGNNYLKLRVNNSEEGIQKLVNCVFKYNKNDVKYGYINIELIISEKSKRQIIQEIGKFSILDKDLIINTFFTNLKTVLEKY